MENEINLELNLDQLWNKAVMNVGGSKNTRRNFQNVAGEFWTLANPDFEFGDIDAYIHEMFESSYNFFEVE
jgi:hypothetical protein